jgi:hydroxymethylpyrimidine/phosphomethylpyrimidine kinase
VRVLTIAGVDSSGGAGVTADLRTFAAHDVWGVCAVTAVTAQNRDGVHRIEGIDPDMVAAQVTAVLPVAAVKTGMLASVAVVEAALRTLPVDVPLVVDPVLRATTGEELSVVTPALIARATVVTPNLQEAQHLTGAPDAVSAAKFLVRMGADVAMVTGSETARDVVASASRDVLSLDGVVIDAPNTHGTGCVLSAAIAAELAKGTDPIDACIAAKHFVARALADGWPFFPAP